MEQSTLEVTERSEVFEFARLRDLVNQALHKNFGEATLSTGLTTGFRSLDQEINGFKKGELATISVKPGMGKTALMLSIANNVAIKNNHPVAIFSSERSSSKITNRLIESETGMSLDKLVKGNMKPSERDHMYSLVNSIAKADIFLDDSPNLSIDELQRKARHLKFSLNAELIIIDYLELMTTSIFDNSPREEQLSNIVRAVQKVARELNIPILLFSQMPGYFPRNNQKKPSINDIPVYISGFSDTVLFLHRSDLNSQTGEGFTSSDIVEVIIGKFNNQSDDRVVELRYIESLAKFTDK